MLIQLVGITSVNADFAAPKAKNGEPMELFSVEALGQYIVVRYFHSEPVEGPAVERFFTDLYCNGEGREVYRVTAKIVEPPPPAPTFGTKLRTAIHTLFA